MAFEISTLVFIDDNALLAILFQTDNTVTYCFRPNVFLLVL